MITHQPSYSHETTILSVRKENQVVMAADSQVIMEDLILRSSVQKIRRLANGNVIAGFSGPTIGALAFFDYLEARLEKNPLQLLSNCVDLAIDWHKNTAFSHPDTMMAVINKTHSIVLTGSGDILEAEDGLIGLGPGSSHVLSAARALLEIQELSAQMIAEKAMSTSAEMYNFKNKNFVFEVIDY